MRASFSLLRQGKFDARVVIFPALRYNSHVCKHAACGREARVPFEPKSDRPVYCSECFAKMREEQR